MASATIELHRLRQFLSAILPTEAAFTSLCVDHFSEVAKQISGSMTLDEKIDLLFAYEKPEAIVKAVELRFPQRLPEYQYLLYSDSELREESQKTADISAPNPIFLAALSGDQHHARRVLSCDRFPQWQEFEVFLEEAGHHIYILSGAAGQGHDFFLLRLYLRLRGEVSVESVNVHWREGRFPRTEKDALLALGKAFRCDPTEFALRSHIRAVLRQRHLWLLHPCLRESLSDQLPLLDYFHGLLPRLVGDAKTEHHFKALLAVEWQPANPLLRLLSLFCPRSWEWVQRSHSRADARALCAMLVAGPASNLSRDRPTWLPCIQFAEELSQITQEHVELFCKIIRYPREPDKRAAFARRILAGSDDSEQILWELAKRIPFDLT